MAYKYITNNNLEEKQTYMYSEYGGMSFLREYQDIRMDFVDSVTQSEDDTHITYLELLDLKQRVEKEQKLPRELRNKVDRYVKTFEVRKRLYTEYSWDYKPVINATYLDLENYLVLGRILVTVYNKTSSTKYVSCLLKLNDTLLSIKYQLTNSQANILKELILEELNIVQRLQERMGIS